MFHVKHSIEFSIKSKIKIEYHIKYFPGNKNTQFITIKNPMFHVEHSIEFSIKSKIKIEYCIKYFPGNKNT